MQGSMVCHPDQMQQHRQQQRQAANVCVVVCVRPQVFYHLGELDSALTYALGAGAHFNVDEQSEYVQTLIGEQQQAALCSCGGDLAEVGGWLPRAAAAARAATHPLTTHKHAALWQNSS
jgi:hypothetical protein